MDGLSSHWLTPAKWANNGFHYAIAQAICAGKQGDKYTALQWKNASECVPGNEALGVAAQLAGIKGNGKEGKAPGGSRILQWVQWVGGWQLQPASNIWDPRGICTRTRVCTT
jgi:hypothetical protein